MPMFEDSGVCLPSDAKDQIARLDEQISNFDGWNIDAKERLCAQRIKLLSQAQLDAEPDSESKVRQAQDIADEVFSRLMQFGTSKDNGVGDRVAALEAAWRVYADFARLSEGN